MVKQLKKQIEKLFEAFGARDHYRPERHYMRGPGPKSSAQAKTGPPAGKAKDRPKKALARGARG